MLWLFEPQFHLFKLSIMYIVYFRRKHSTAFYTGDITDVETSNFE